VTQALLSLAMIVVLGTPGGRTGVDTLFSLVGLKGMSWEGRKGFDTLLRCTAPVFWLFFLLTGISLFVLRILDRRRERPFPVPFFPVLPLIFCATCAYMLYGGIQYAGNLGLIGGLLLLAGLPLYWISCLWARPPAGGPASE
jgi:amino acid transporter